MANSEKKCVILRMLKLRIRTFFLQNGIKEFLQPIYY